MTSGRTLPPLLVRADATARMGTGHVMRGLALAQAWQDAGGAVTFTAATLPKILQDRLVDEGCEVMSITADPGSPTDVSETIAIANRVAADWIVLDGYQFDSGFQQSLKDSGLRVLAVDDYGHAGRYSADLVLNQNLGANEDLYADRAPSTRLLLGPRFAMLRREFTTAPGWTRRIPDVARKVLVTLGGADPDNVTLTVIKSLGQVCVDGLEAVVVVGASNPHLAVLETAAQRSQVRIELQVNVTDMPALMRWADVAVAAGGTTSWERAAFGLPGLVLVLADNQRRVAEACDAAGLGRNLGWHEQVTETTLAEALGGLLHDLDARTGMVFHSRQVVDGRGAERVLHAMTDFTLLLRPATIDDAQLLWDWVNDPVVRRSAFSSTPIPWDGHVDWLSRQLVNPNCRIYIAQNAAGQPVGQVRFDRTSLREGEIDVNVAADHRGRGIGSKLIRAGVKHVFATGWVTRVNAYIKLDNVASLGSFKTAGFEVIGEVEVRGERAIQTAKETGHG